MYDRRLCTAWSFQGTLNVSAFDSLHPALSHQILTECLQIMNMLLATGQMGLDQEDGLKDHLS